MSGASGEMPYAEDLEVVTPTTESVLRVAPEVAPPTVEVAHRITNKATTSAPHVNTTVCHGDQIGDDAMCLQARLQRTRQLGGRHRSCRDYLDSAVVMKL